MSKAQQKVSSKRPTIGYLTPWIHGPISRALWTGIDDSARQHDVNLICFTGGNLGASTIEEFDAQRNVLYDLVTSSTVDGLVISSAALSLCVSPEEIQAFCDNMLLASQSVTVDVGDCTPGAPDVLANSLRVVKNMPVGSVFQWQSSSTGQWNLHVTNLKGEIPDLWMNMSAVQILALDTTADDDGSFPPGFYQVYGADNCTGASVP